MVVDSSPMVTGIIDLPRNSRSRDRRFVRGTGVTRGTPQLRVGAKVELVDLGPWFDGSYLVTAVTHRFDQHEGYRSEFEAQRPHLGESS